MTKGTRKMGRCAVGCLVALMMVGCGDGGAAVAKRRDVLSKLGLAYHEFNAQQQRPPASIKELADFVRSAEPTDRDLEALTGLEEGDVVMNWNGRLGESAENGLYVLGFEARCPASGGYVVMADGFVQLMTGQEFSAARMVPAVEAAE